MKHLAKFLSVSTFLFFPGYGFAEFLRLKASSLEMHCTAIHDCSAPLDCSGDDFSDCKPRKGYCKDPLDFAFQLLKAEDVSDQKAYAAIALSGQEKFVLSGAKIVLEHQNNEALVFVNGQPPLAEFKNWDVMLSDNGQIGVHVELSSGIPSKRSYHGTCQVKD